MQRMMSKIGITVALFALTAPAADFWAQKKFLDWNQKECQRLLNDSPWARVVEFHPPGDGGGDDEDAPGRLNCDTCSDSGNRGALPPSVLATVRWQTALPVKQALAKTRFGDEVKNSPEAASLLGQREPFFVVALAGLPRKFVRTSAQRIKSNSILKVKNKPPIAAASVRGEALPNERAVVYLTFPRTQNGVPAISIEDAEVEFDLDLGPSDIKRKFKLKDMVYEGKLEL